MWLYRYLLPVLLYFIEDLRQEMCSTMFNLGIVFIAISQYGKKGISYFAYKGVKFQQ